MNHQCTFCVPFLQRSHMLPFILQSSKLHLCRLKKNTGRIKEEAVSGK